MIKKLLLIHLVYFAFVGNTAMALEFLVLDQKMTFTHAVSACQNRRMHVLTSAELDGLLLFPGRLAETNPQGDVVVQEWHKKFGSVEPRTDRQFNEMPAFWVDRRALHDSSIGVSEILSRALFGGPNNGLGVGGFAQPTFLNYVLCTSTEGVPVAMN